jgi:hypothetical protein
MTSDFKVMEWLRQVRDENAEEEKGLSPQEKLSRTEQGSQEILDAMLRDPRNAIHRAGERREVK